MRNALSHLEIITTSAAGLRKLDEWARRDAAEGTGATASEMALRSALTEIAHHASLWLKELAGGAGR